MATTAAAPSRTDWLAWRKTGIGGSDAPVVAGRSPYKSRTELWLEKVGKAPHQDFMSAPMKWGLRLEDAIATALQERIGCNYVGDQVCMASDERPWQLATLDRLTDDHRVVELKSVNPGVARTLGEDGDNESLPESWVLQAQHQLAVTKLDVVVFAVFVGTLEDVRVFEVERNDSLIDALNEVEAEFWESVQTNTPPLALDVRDSEALVKHLGVQEGQIALPEDIESVVDEYDAIKAQIALLEDMKGAAKAKIIDSLCGVSSGVLPGGRIVKCSVTDIAEGVSARKAHRRINLSFRNPARA